MICYADSSFLIGWFHPLRVAAFLESKAHYFATLDKLQAELACTLVARQRVKIFAK